ncbi:tryptophan--tRNA ligase [archaeon]|jgi:tryptophanyl-tRNA synthetase|nr:tryptophan--tRNA ligase [archaeon]MBT3451106.1 tryptophan--tRNA ligase [archaeon]MBT6868650.1 tryptophan--tRNA ligase [archaeon]MBT7193383.1 tryptophan--tRNA ligase [archaeon]MBT7381447.1 tryptophan--tRNA ligase [archaeon]
MVSKVSPKVNPYEVEGKIDYDRIVKDFGIKKLTKSDLGRIKRLAGELHPYLRRGIFFANRDLNWCLDEYEKGNKFFLYTGCGPSGPIHLGHLGTWRFTKWLQDKFGVELWFQFTDDEKFLFKNKSYQEIQDWTYENMLDVIALGFDSKKTHFLVDTKHAGIMYPEAIKVAKKITFSTIKAAFGFKDSSNIGSIFYTSMQTVPVFLPNVLRNEKRPCLIPLGVDQDPHFRISRDVVEKLGHKKPAVLHSKFMPPITGLEGKMSSSFADHAILTTDTPKQVKKKINKYAFSGGQPTVEEHRKLGGNPDIDVSFQWLKYFEFDDNKLVQIEKDYRSGKLLSGELKLILIEKVNSFLAEHQKKREQAKKQIDKYLYKI